jgi:hypothetical protein
MLHHYRRGYNVVGVENLVQIMESQRVRLQGTFAVELLRTYAMLKQFDKVTTNCTMQI